jgi:hypothetical protein
MFDTTIPATPFSQRLVRMRQLKPRSKGGGPVA